MQAPWWVYIVAVLVALPAYVLWAVGVYMLARALGSWFVMSDPAPPPKVPPSTAVKG